VKYLLVSDYGGQELYQASAFVHCGERAQHGPMPPYCWGWSITDT